MAVATVKAVGEREDGRVSPYLKQGKPVPKGASLDKALKVAGLDWEVGLFPVQALVEGKRVNIDHRQAVVNLTSGVVYDVVGQGYATVQNRDGLGIAEGLSEQGCEFVVAGELAQGRVVWIQVKMPDGFLVGGQDPYDLYGLLEASHDGKRAVRFHITPTRLDCLNQLNAAISGAERRFSVRHTSSAPEKLEEARHAIKKTGEYVEAFQSEMDGLLTKKISEKALVEFLNRLVPDRDKKPQEVEAIRTLAVDAATNEFGRGTRYAAFQAVREYYDHVRPQRTAESSMIGALTGVNVRMQDRALEMLRA